MNSPVPLMLLHGWGFSSRIWQPLLKKAEDRWPAPVFAVDLPGFGTAYHEPCGGVDEAIDFILEQLPARSVLCGWSLGGMLATRLAARHPQRVAGLVTLGSNLHFTRTGNWPGMPENDYREFCARFDAYPEKTWQHFLALQTRGDLYSGEFAPVLKRLSGFVDLEPDMASKMLGLLGDLDNREVFRALQVPGLHLFGEHDAITPASVGDALYALNPKQRIHILPAAAHALCVTRVDDVNALLSEFAKSLFASSTPDSAATPLGSTWTDARTTPPPLLSSGDNMPREPFIPREQIARAFSRAAESYDHAAGLQRTVAEHLLSSVYVSGSCAVLDAGCGTGFLTQALQPVSHFNLALDLAPGMLQATRKRCGNPVARVQADMQSLPVGDARMDCIVSSLALQWCAEPTRFFAECRRVLNPDGSLCFSTFLPGTLHELQQAWQNVDDAVHVNTFVDMHTLLDGLHQAGFHSVEADVQTLARYYPDLRTLAQELKAIGAHNMNPGRPTGLTGKHRWQQLQQAYETFRQAEGLPAHYEVLYVVAR